MKIAREIRADQSGTTTHNWALVATGAQLTY